ncbi:hypothetical protein F5148DRAFT_194424 [Russula earlei]|uniref:Uncharacterized protein n=1 Tax=Russula earlei TaxID=71964 RepID=A0ACC0TQZ9_9AGAM|nr:hypothetical protein F5148DRAFT_194424 [Russula earlei]
MVPLAWQTCLPPWTCLHSRIYSRRAITSLQLQPFPPQPYLLRVLFAHLLGFQILGWFTSVCLSLGPGRFLGFYGIWAPYFCAIESTSLQETELEEVGVPKGSANDGAVPKARQNMTNTEARIVTYERDYEFKSSKYEQDGGGESVGRLSVTST